MVCTDRLLEDSVSCVILDVRTPSGCDRRDVVVTDGVVAVALPTGATVRHRYLQRERERG
ncbi:hypothetical protein Hanom_Chr11g01039951 [Helianthus anomalus]